MSSSNSREELFVISVAAKLSGMHAQTLRTYDRMGLVTPQRTQGGGRRYSRDDIDLLRWIQHLSQEEGVNLAGIRTIIQLQREKSEVEEALQDVVEENTKLRSKVDDLSDKLSQPGHRGGELVHVPRSTAVVVWKRH